MPSARFERLFGGVWQGSDKGRGNTRRNRIGQNSESFVREIIALKTAIRWVDFEAGERVGAVYGPRLGSQRTATPPAFIMFVFCKVSPLSKYGAVFVAWMPYTVPYLKNLLKK